MGRLAGSGHTGCHPNRWTRAMFHLHLPFSHLAAGEAGARATGDARVDPDRRRFLLQGAAATLATPSAALLPSYARARAGAMPWQPMLAQEAHADVDPRAYLVSEKLDGVRALWDGRALWFRSGLPIAAPSAFLARLPADPLDGELWFGRGQFESLVGIVRRSNPAAGAWQDVRLMAFDMPRQPGPFAARAAVLAALGQRQGNPAWAPVQQHRLADAQALQALLSQVTRDGGEGLMLHRADALWQGGRSAALLKFKPVADAEAQVLAHVPGQGRHAGRVGALRVRTAEGVEFKLGTGLTDAQREQPPPVGQWVTYTYRGTTEAGLPRFASFRRMREL
jgi:DNA ligase-1